MMLSIRKIITTFHKYISYLSCGLLFMACFLIGCAKEEKKEDPFPFSYVAEVDEKIERIRLISQKNDIADSFFFITDLHWDYNDKKSPKIIKYIESSVPIKTIVFGGDYLCRFNPDKDLAMANLGECINAFNAEEYYAIIGNHEANWSGNEEDASSVISSSESNQVLNQGRFEKSYFCVGNESNHICKVFLDTNDFSKGGEQYNWLKDKLLSLNANETVFIFMHIYNDYKSPGIPVTLARPGNLLNELFLEISDSMVCSVGGIFSGHTHRDFMEKNDLGYTALSTTCDCRGNYYACDDLYVRNKGEFSEQAFDVVQVDTSNRKVYLTRIGAGYDREYTY